MLWTHPGESGIGNAVNAVTAGYNTLAQQRQMQVARELAEREWKAKEAKAAQDKLESEARIGGIKSESERRAAQSAKDRADARRDAAQAGRRAGVRLSSYLLARDLRNGPTSSGARLIERIIVHILPSGATI